MSFYCQHYSSNEMLASSKYLLVECQHLQKYAGGYSEDAFVDLKPLAHFPQYNQSVIGGFGY